ncbi:MAG: sirohydrochlorin cobaltochelatase [archaeon]|nr:sirohydrochlorin cobaltochelatase [archaeon]
MSRKGVLIIGHGSNYRYNEHIMELQRQRLQGMGFEDVYIGYNEMSKPSIEESLSKMIADGINEVIAMPFFVASGLHMERDIPPKLFLKNGEHDKNIEVDGKKLVMHFGEPFGNDPLLTEILKEKASELGASSDSAIIIVGHGSKLPYNKEVVMENAKRLSKMGISNVYYAFNEFNRPTIEEVIDEIIKGDICEIIVLPLFISKGDHLINDIPPKIHLTDGACECTFEHDGKMITVRYAEPIGEDPRLTDLFATKIRSYWV